jgi:hypothetical protein
MGGGKSSGSTSATLTPEQKELLGLQVGALKDTFLPAYQNTVTGANTMLQQTMPYTNQAAQNAYQNAASISNAQNSIGGELVGAGRNLATAGTTGVLNTANQLSNAANQLGYAGGGGAKSGGRSFSQEEFLGYAWSYAKDLIVAGKKAKDLEELNKMATYIYERIGVMLNGESQAPEDDSISDINELGKANSSNDDQPF